MAVMTEQAPDGPQPAAYLVERALQRSRVTVFFRFVLVIPHLIVLYVLGLAAIPVWLFGLLATLVLGRLPRWVRSYLGGVGGWYQRALSYYSLLTDRWPRFRFTDPDYPVQVTLPEATPIARWTVLLRIPLIPVAYVMTTLLGGIWLFVVFAWFAGVFAGRTPRAVFDAIATTQRFQWRIYAYMGLLVPTFPWGIFGDGIAPPVYPGYPSYPVAPSYPAYPSSPPGYGYPPPGYPPSSAPPAEADTQEPPTPAPRPRPSPFPRPAAAPDPAPELPSYPPPAGGGYSPPAYPPPPQAYPAAQQPSTWAYAPMPPARDWAVASVADRREPGWYDGLISQGSKAILIIVVVIGGLQLLLNGVQISRGGAGLGLLQLNNVVRIQSADNELDSVDATCDDATCAAQLQAAAATLQARVEKAPSRGGRRERVLADIGRLDSDLATNGTANLGISPEVIADIAQIDSDVEDLTNALLRG